jgi:hypothetical protein
MDHLFKEGLDNMDNFQDSNTFFIFLANGLALYEDILYSHYL